MAEKSDRFDQTVLSDSAKSSESSEKENTPCVCAGSDVCGSPADDDSYYTDEIIEPKIMKYIRTGLILVLVISILMFIYRYFVGFGNEMTLDEYVENEFFFLFFTVATLIYLSLPTYVQKKMNFVADPWLVIAIVLFIFAGSFLGQGLGFFERFAWWDTMLHTISGVILGLIAFALTSALNDSKKCGLYLNPFYVALFSFTFAVAVGALWEIVEYSFDWILATTMQCWDQDPSLYLTGRIYQGAGLIDTMEDLIVDAIGAFFVSAVGYFYLVRGKPFMEGKRLRKSEQRKKSGKYGSRPENKYKK
ncbi:hypothetical protein [Methanolapillus millepedarum]|uniref:DUF2238 domain-containing protein n=1 Tax=Methanolapillus millepedarum TaxID=3028296 RepID=A0AA96V390_9EURY|nr:hypothetical protein MsAc7_08340 [Methanosarcinaceae archaeon Ac7]